ncbi:MAG: lipopolysaccharide biosynthesis protein [Desulfovibrionaceae bacterium]|nr:lipopolysaccharide biosynthesis protein [Desulfovibrionaceae bacterium]
MQGKTPTLARRYLFKLLANIAAVPVYLAMEAILPRALGPRLYGEYSFATNLFYQMAGFLDMGTSTCMYNSLSRRQTEGGLVSFYLRVSGLVLLITMSAGLFLSAVPSCGSLLLPDVPLWLVPFAAFWAFLTWWCQVMRSMNDAIGATVPSELVRTTVSLVAVCALCLLFVLDALNIVTLLAQQYAMLGITALGYWLVTTRCGRGTWENGGRLAWSIEKKRFRAYCREFYEYSNPLFIKALIVFVMIAVERWLLQWFNGSAEQGFFALSQKVCMACFLFVSAMTPLLMRELSISWGQRDLAAMGRLVDRFAPLLYVVAAYFSCFTLAEAPALVYIFGGSEFAAAVLPVQIMALYPLHQAYGQLGTSIFHATGRTRVLRNIQICELFYGLGTAWVLLAPPELCGLGFGATGLAVKTVCVQMVTVNLYLWLASRFVPLHFWRNLGHQVWSLLLLLGLAWLCRWLTIEAGLGDLTSIMRFLCSGVIYTVLTAAVGLAFPALLGLTRQDMKNLLERFLGRFLHRGA